MTDMLSKVGHISVKVCHFFLLLKTGSISKEFTKLRVTYIILNYTTSLGVWSQSFYTLQVNMHEVQDITQSLTHYYGPSNNK